MKRPIFVLFVCATILFVKAAQKQKCKKTDIKSLKGELIEAIGNLTEKLTKEINHNEEKLTAQKEELIETFDSKLQATKNDIKAELANEIGNLTEKLTKEINQNEEKLKVDMNSKLDQIKNDIKGELNNEIDQLTESMNQKCDDLNKKLIEAFNNKLVETTNGIKAELTAEINQNEDKLNALKTQNQGTLSTLTAQLTKSTTKLSGCACERQNLRGIIYYAGPYKYTFAAAKAYCISKGHRIATAAQIRAAFDLGMSQCSWGWVRDGTVMFPQQMPFENSTGCGPRGANEWARDHSNKFGVYCSRLA